MIAEDSEEVEFAEDDPTCTMAPLVSSGEEISTLFQSMIAAPAEEQREGATKENPRSSDLQMVKK